MRVLGLGFSGFKVFGFRVLRFWGLRALGFSGLGFRRDFSPGKGERETLSKPEVIPVSVSCSNCLSV